MKESKIAREFREKITDLKVERKKLIRYLTLKSENMELNFPYDNQVIGAIDPLKEAFENGKAIEIEGEVESNIPLFHELYKGSIKIEGKERYKFTYGRSKTFPRGTSFKFEYLGN